MGATIIQKCDSCYGLKTFMGHYFLRSGCCIALLNWMWCLATSAAQLNHDWNRGTSFECEACFGLRAGTDMKKQVWVSYQIPKRNLQVGSSMGVYIRAGAPMWNNRPESTFEVSLTNKILELFYHSKTLRSIIGNHDSSPNTLEGQVLRCN